MYFSLQLWFQRLQARTWVFLEKEIKNVGQTFYEILTIMCLQDTDRIKTKAQVSHKERVEKFNAYLNSLSEHYEPAKVSWTK